MKYHASATEFEKKNTIEKDMKMKTKILLNVFTVLFENLEANFSLYRFV